MKHVELTDDELAAITHAAELLSVEFTKLKLSNEKRLIVHASCLWGMLSVVMRASSTGAVWLDITSQFLDHGKSCVRTNPPGRASNHADMVITESRFDATNFVKWVEEEITEAIIRGRIILMMKERAGLHGYKEHMSAMKARTSNSPDVAESQIGFRLM